MFMHLVSRDIIRSPKRSGPPNLLSISLAISLCFCSIVLDPVLEEWTKDGKRSCSQFFPISLKFSCLLLYSLVFSPSLSSLHEFERLSLDSIDDEKRSRQLLVSILPKKGPDSFDRFLRVLKETQGQEHVARKLLGEEEKREQKRKAQGKREIH